MPQSSLPLAANFAGLDRLNAPQNVDPSKSPDCSDCRAAGKFTGKLGPRLGRHRASSTAFPLLGMGGFLTDNGEHWRVTAETDGTWRASEVPWPSPQSPSATPSGWDRIEIQNIAVVGVAGSVTYSAVESVGSFLLTGYGRGLILPNPSEGRYTYSAPSVGTPDTADITSNLATITFLAPHGLTTQDIISVALDTGDFNGVFVVTVINSTTITYPVVASDVPSYTPTGTVRSAGTTSLFDGTITLQGKISGVWTDLYTALSALTGTLTDIRLKADLSAISASGTFTFSWDVYLIHNSENSVVTIP